MPRSKKRVTAVGPDGVAEALEHGSYRYKNGTKYRGEWKPGVGAHGEGELFFASGEKYSGQFRKNQFHGQGCYTYANGDTYAGQWDTGEPNGQGVYTYGKDSSSLSGDWRQGKMHGKGSLQFKSGASFVGTFQDDMKHGEGTLTYRNGDTYQGEFGRNRFEGQGTYDAFSQRISYEGLWAENRMAPARKGSNFVFHSDFGHRTFQAKPRKKLGEWWKQGNPIGRNGASRGPLRPTTSQGFSSFMDARLASPTNSSYSKDSRPGTAAAATALSPSSRLGTPASRLGTPGSRLGSPKGF